MRISKTRFILNNTVFMIYSMVPMNSMRKSNNKSKTIKGTGSTIYGSCDVSDIIVCSGAGTGYTIAACNVGATTAGTGPSSDGGLFQRGNNADIRTAPTSTTQIGTTTSNSTYSNYMFILSTYNWTPIQNENLWGYNGGNGTNIQRKGPCATGYHVPRASEWEGIFTSGGWSSSPGTLFSNDLKLPTAGNRYSNGSLVNNTSGYYWASTEGINSYKRILSFSIYINPYTSKYPTEGISVRCFKN